ncbi:MAG: ATP-binding protein [Endomicrobiaceae bacterium]|nr:ATP-binding protein [Endomicrobiaceae bacterium]
MKINKIFIKIFLSIFLTVLCVSAVFFITANNYVDEKYKAFFLDALNSNKTIVAHSLLPLYQSDDYGSVQKIVDEYGQLLNRRITVIALDGQVIADSQSKSVDMANHSDRKEVQEALKGNEAHNIRYSSTLNKKMLYTASLIKINEKPVVILRLSMPLESINIFANEMRGKIIIIILIVLCISLIIASVIAFKISAKITNLKDASARLAGGDFSVKINSDSNDEIDQLCDSFNTMSEQIEVLFTKTNEEKDKLDKIMESVNDTILVIDKSGKIIIHNSAFKKYFKNINPDHRYFWEIFRDKKLEEIIKELSADKNNILFSEIEHENKTYSLTASNIKTNDNIVLTFHDITTIKQMAMMKKEFVTNASHELKTPLTAISCFVENIESEDDINTVKYYISIIKKHSERLTKIVTDLLSLSELENNKNMELAKLDISKTIAPIIDLYKNKIEQKHLKLEFIKPESDFIINGNEFYIEQMLMNLIDNALRYTEKGQITVKLEKENNKINLIVEDTGIGIAQEHLPRLFERFYVVDKARSRKSGGTGLGLSIVKYITNIHNATINLDSKVNAGTTVVISFNAI